MARRAVGTVVALALVMLPAIASAATRAETKTAGPITATLTTTYTQALGPTLIAKSLSLHLERTDGVPAATFTDTGLDPNGVEGDFVASPGALRLIDVTGDGEPEALVDLFTGGAHCCFVTYVAWREPASNAYRVVIGFWGDPPTRVRDLDGNGIPEFDGRDDRFAYAFGSYADSVFPRRIWNLRGGRLVDTSREFPAIFRRELRSSWATYVRYKRLGYPTASALAAYVATAYRAGGRNPSLAWRRARASEGPRRAPVLRAIKRRLVRWGYVPA